MKRKLRRGMIIDVDLDPAQGSETGKVRPCVIVTNDTYNQRVPVVQVTPLTAWNEKKGRIAATRKNGLTKKSVADCLQTRPIDHQRRLMLIKIRGRLTDAELSAVDEALKVVFQLT